MKSDEKKSVGRGGSFFRNHKNSFNDDDDDFYKRIKLIRCLVNVPNSTQTPIKWGRIQRSMENIQQIIVSRAENIEKSSRCNVSESFPIFDENPH